MNMSKSELREALKVKLDHRRQLMQENYGLRGDVSRERDRNKFLLGVLSNPLVDMVLEDCADHLMKSIMNEAVKASQVVADQTIDNGDYEIGISIPSLHIRHRIMREDFRHVQLMSDRPVRQINIQNGEPS